MMSITGWILLLIVFSVALAAVVSAYRDDEPSVILRGTLRRALLFGLAVAAIGATAVTLETLFLRPGD